MTITAAVPRGEVQGEALRPIPVAGIMTGSMTEISIATGTIVTETTGETLAEIMTGVIMTGIGILIVTLTDTAPAAAGIGMMILTDLTGSVLRQTGKITMEIEKRNLPLGATGAITPLRVAAAGAAEETATTEAAVALSRATAATMVGIVPRKGSAGAAIGTSAAPLRPIVVERSRSCLLWSDWWLLFLLRW